MLHINRSCYLFTYLPVYDIIQPFSVMFPSHQFTIPPAKHSGLVLIAFAYGTLNSSFLLLLNDHLSSCRYDQTGSYASVIVLTLSASKTDMPKQELQDHMLV